VNYAIEMQECIKNETGMVDHKESEVVRKVKVSKVGRTPTASSPGNCDGRGSMQRLPLG
jgi:hypothetical protein